MGTKIKDLYIIFFTNLMYINSFKPNIKVTNMGSRGIFTKRNIKKQFVHVYMKNIYKDNYKNNKDQ